MQTVRGYRIVLSAVACSGLLVACTTAMYNGPRRQPHEIATLRSEDTRINYVDGKWVRDDAWAGNKAMYEVLPGWHSVGISLEVNKNYVIFTETTYSKTITLCLDAKVGHTYVTAPVVSADSWQPRIVDESSNHSVGVDCRRRGGLIAPPKSLPPDTSSESSTPDGGALD
jgi:hypothetical protein